jgi:hypothetical protein
MDSQQMELLLRMQSPQQKLQAEAAEAKLRGKAEVAGEGKPQASEEETPNPGKEGEANAARNPVVRLLESMADWTYTRSLAKLAEWQDAPLLLEDMPQFVTRSVLSVCPLRRLQSPVYATEEAKIVTEMWRSKSAVDTHRALATAGAHLTDILDQLVICCHEET